MALFAIGDLHLSFGDQFKPMDIFSGWEGYTEKLEANWKNTISDEDTVVLAGFMRIVKPKLLEAFPNRVLNIHPAILPAFPGVHSWTQALSYGCKVAGVTVHFVDAGTDSGPIIVQKAVPVLEDDTHETLHARIQVQEHIAYPEALRIIASGAYRVEGRRVRIFNS